MIEIQRIELPLPGIDDLQREARHEGYSFIDRLVKEWSSGENRFDKQGEVLRGCIDQGMLVGVGALNRDPFTDAADVGRIRRVYVRPASRNKGLGRALVASLVVDARKYFRCVRLRAGSPMAAKLYESIGFSPVADPNATHILIFDGASEATR